MCIFDLQWSAGRPPYDIRGQLLSAITNKRGVKKFQGALATKPVIYGEPNTNWLWLLRSKNWEATPDSIVAKLTTHPFFTDPITGRTRVLVRKTNISELCSGDLLPTDRLLFMLSKDADARKNDGWFASDQAKKLRSLTEAENAVAAAVEDL